MPAYPKPLKVTEPAERPPGIPDGLWAFPRNLADEANAQHLSQKEVATKIGVRQSTISRWLRYEGIEGLKVADVVRLEQALGLKHGELTLSATALRQRVRGIEVETHSSLPPSETEKVRTRAERKVRNKTPANPRLGTRPKRDNA